MLSILSGAMLVGAGGTTLWWFAPRRGIVHPIVTKPLLDSGIAIAVLGLSALGIAFLISGFFG
jgi:hypothetical protein